MFFPPSERGYMCCRFITCPDANAFFLRLDTVLVTETATLLPLLYAEWIKHILESLKLVLKILAA